METSQFQQKTVEIRLGHRAGGQDDVAKQKIIAELGKMIIGEENVVHRCC